VHSGLFGFIGGATITNADVRWQQNPKPIARIDTVANAPVKVRGQLGARTQLVKPITAG
jgi:hypothetical protein